MREVVGHPLASEIEAQIRATEARLAQVGSNRRNRVQQGGSVGWLQERLETEARSRQLAERIARGEAETRRSLELQLTESKAAEHEAQRQLRQRFVLARGDSSPKHEEERIGAIQAGGSGWQRDLAAARTVRAAGKMAELEERLGELEDKLATEIKRRALAESRLAEAQAQMEGSEAARAKAEAQLASVVADQIQMERDQSVEIEKLSSELAQSKAAAQRLGQTVKAEAHRDLLRRAGLRTEMALRGLSRFLRASAVGGQCRLLAGWRAAARDTASRSNPTSRRTVELNKTLRRVQRELMFVMHKRAGVCVHIWKQLCRAERVQSESLRRIRRVFVGHTRGAAGRCLHDWKDNLVREAKMAAIRRSSAAAKMVAGAAKAEAQAALADQHAEVVDAQTANRKATSMLLDAEEAIQALEDELEDSKATSRRLEAELEAKAKADQAQTQLEKQNTLLEGELEDSKATSRRLQAELEAKAKADQAQTQLEKQNALLEGELLSAMEERCRLLQHQAAEREEALTVEAEGLRKELALARAKVTLQGDKNAQKATLRGLRRTIGFMMRGALGLAIHEWKAGLRDEMEQNSAAFIAQHETEVSKLQEMLREQELKTEWLLLKAEHDHDEAEMQAMEDQGAIEALTELIAQFSETGEQTKSAQEDQLMRISVQKLRRIFGGMVKDTIGLCLLDWRDKIKDEKIVNAEFQKQAKSAQEDQLMRISVQKLRRIFGGMVKDAIGLCLLDWRDKIKDEKIVNAEFQNAKDFGSALSGLNDGQKVKGLDKMRRSMMSLARGEAGIYIFSWSTNMKESRKRVWNEACLNRGMKALRRIFASTIKGAAGSCVYTWRDRMRERRQLLQRQAVEKEAEELAYCQMDKEALSVEVEGLRKELALARAKDLDSQLQHDLDSQLQHEEGAKANALQRSIEQAKQGLHEQALQDEEVLQTLKDEVAKLETSLSDVLA